MVGCWFYGALEEEEEEKRKIFLEGGVVYTAKMEVRPVSNIFYESNSFIVLW